MKGQGLVSSQSEAAGGHLSYYKERGISPVRYNYADLASHFQRRDSLYRSLGLPPAAFRGVRVLEVAAGSGQNSLYVATRQPAAYDLVEPNPAGERDIQAAYAGLALDHTAPQLHTTRFEDFAANASYDIVLCENWLGSLPHEIALIRKLASLVAPGGVLVLTAVPLSGFFPNVMRKLLALRAVNVAAPFEVQVAQLAEMFGPHLATIANMTRSHEDWVKDCLLNPHYLNVALPLETVVEAVGAEMEILATFPRFTADWRWFKSLAGEGRNFNALTLEACRRNTHNFIDYRSLFPARPAASNAKLESAFAEFHRSALAWQKAFDASDDGARSKLDADIGARLDALAVMMGDIDRGLAEAVTEAASVWRQPTITADSIRNMRKFGGLFGRETVYMSLTRSE
jgi:2-polyprenyl-3-methyl-5-hydroxy-6-metoxy-1,4-benzoquinol methylase